MCHTPVPIPISRPLVTCTTNLLPAGKLAVVMLENVLVPIISLKLGIVMATDDGVNVDKIPAVVTVPKVNVRSPIIGANATVTVTIGFCVVRAIDDGKVNVIKLVSIDKFTKLPAIVGIAASARPNGTKKSATVRSGVKIDIGAIVQ